MNTAAIILPDIFDCLNRAISTRDSPPGINKAQKACEYPHMASALRAPQLLKHTGRVLLARNHHSRTSSLMSPKTTPPSEIMPRSGIGSAKSFSC